MRVSERVFRGLTGPVTRSSCCTPFCAFLRQKCSGQWMACLELPYPRLRTRDLCIHVEEPEARYTHLRDSRRWCVRIHLVLILNVAHCAGTEIDVRNVRDSLMSNIVYPSSTIVLPFYILSYSLG